MYRYFSFHTTITFFFGSRSHHMLKKSQNLLNTINIAHHRNTTSDVFLIKTKVRQKSHILLLPLYHNIVDEFF